MLPLPSFGAVSFVVYRGLAYPFILWLQDRRCLRRSWSKSYRMYLRPIPKFEELARQSSRTSMQPSAIVIFQISSEARCDIANDMAYQSCLLCIGFERPCLIALARPTLPGSARGHYCRIDIHVRAPSPNRMNFIG